MGNLYEKEFDEKLGRRQCWRMISLQWTDEDVVKLCGAIATGKLVKLERLLLNNQIGDAGAAALAEAVGKLPQLKKLDLTQPQHLPASQGRPQGRPAQL